MSNAARAFSATVKLAFLWMIADRLMEDLQSGVDVRSRLGPINRLLAWSDLQGGWDLVALFNKVGWLDALRLRWRRCAMWMWREP